MAPVKLTPQVGQDQLGGKGPGVQAEDVVFRIHSSAQLMVIDPDGSFRERLSMMVPREGGFPEIIHPRFVDSAGNLYHQASRSRSGGPADSAAVTRFSRSSSTFDTVATIWLPENSQVRSQRFGFLPRMLEPRDDWAVCADGRNAEFGDFLDHDGFPERRSISPGISLTSCS
jgi:hypothetical protein